VESLRTGLKEFGRARWGAFVDTALPLGRNEGKNGEVSLGTARASRSASSVSLAQLGEWAKP